MAAAHFGVPNLTAIVDYNHLQTDGTTEEVMDIGDVRAKFEAFGWDAVEIDGHDMNGGRRGARAQPHAATARGDRRQTKKGKGVSSMEGRFGFHGKPPTPEQAEQALEELRPGWTSRPRRCRGGRTAKRVADARARGQDRADRNPPRLRRRAARSSASATRTSSRWMPIWPSPPSRSSSASGSRSASSTSGRPRRT